MGKSVCALLALGVLVCSSVALADEEYEGDSTNGDVVTRTAEMKTDGRFYSACTAAQSHAKKRAEEACAQMGFDGEALDLASSILSQGPVTSPADVSYGFREWCEASVTVKCKNKPVSRYPLCSIDESRFPHRYNVTLYRKPYERGTQIGRYRDYTSARASLEQAVSKGWCNLAR